MSEEKVVNEEALEKETSALKKMDNNAFAKKHPEIWKIIKWILVSGFANVPELVIYMLLLNLFTRLNVTSLGFLSFMEKVIPEDPSYSVAVVVFAYMLSTAVGYTIAFILNRKATFHANSNVVFSTVAQIIVVIFTIFMNGLFVGPWINKFVTVLGLSVVLTNIISKFLCMMVPGLWTYPLNRFVIHRVKKEQKGQEEQKEQVSEVV